MFFQQEDSGKPYVYHPTSRLYYFLLFSLVSFKLMTRTQFTQYLF